MTFALLSFFLLRSLLTHFGNTQEAETTRNIKQILEENKEKKEKKIFRRFSAFYGQCLVAEA